jgi:hypothetical protein
MEESSKRTQIQERDRDGQLGPDEISEPDEVRKSNEAKLHHEDMQPDHSEREGDDEPTGM